MTDVIQNPNIGRALQEMLGLQGRVRPSLDMVVVPTVQVANCEMTGYVCRSRSASATLLQAAVGGQRPTFQFQAPPGVLALISSIFMNASSEFFLAATFSQNAAALGTSALAQYTDQRLIQEGAIPSCDLTVGTQAAAITPIEWGIRVQSDVASEEALTTHNPKNWVVGSGVAGVPRTLGIQGQSVNLDMRLTIEWIEFQLTN